MFMILHKNSICITDETPDERVGQPVTQRQRDVVCQEHRQSGIIAAPGYEHQILHEWATRNGYAVTQDQIQYHLDLHPQNGHTGLFSPSYRRNA